MGVAHRPADLLLFTRRRVGGAQGVVKNHHALGAGGLLYQFLGFLVVQGANFVLVVEVFHLGLMIDEDESFALQRQLIGDGAAVVNRHLVLLVFALFLLVGHRLSHTAVTGRFFAA